MGTGLELATFDRGGLLAIIDGLEAINAEPAPSIAD